MRADYRLVLDVTACMGSPANSRKEGMGPHMGACHRRCQARQVLEEKQCLPDSRRWGCGAGKWVRQGPGGGLGTRERAQGSLAQKLERQQRNRRERP